MGRDREGEPVTAAPHSTSAGRRAWIERIAPDWAARATALRVIGDPSSVLRATVIASIVTALRREVDDVPNVSANAEAVADLERRLRRSLPYKHAVVDVMINDALILVAVRARLCAQMIALGGKPPDDLVRAIAAAASSSPPLPVPQAPLLPPPEVQPFAMGPQLEFLV
jgi:hypothetical protein